MVNGLRSAFLSIFLGYALSLFGISIEERINLIPVSERNCIREFFNFAFKHDQVGHTLFFESKPICFTGVIIKMDEMSITDKLCTKGWRCFKKYEHLFPHPNFIFNENIYNSEELKVVDIYLANKKSLIKCLNKHEKLFKERLGNAYDFENFLSRLEKEPLNSIIKDDEKLLGILLGFGDEASTAFDEAQKKCLDSAVPEWTDTYCAVEGKQPLECKLSPIVFMGNPNSTEIKQIIANYDKELEQIWFLYKQSKDPLKLFLTQLCQN